MHPCPTSSPQSLGWTSCPFVDNFKRSTDLCASALQDGADSEPHVHQAAAEAEGHPQSPPEAGFSNPSRQEVAVADKHHAKGYALRKQGNFAEAIEEYSEAIRLHSRHLKSLFNRAFSYDKVYDLSLEARSPCGEAREEGGRGQRILLKAIDEVDPAGDSR